MKKIFYITALIFMASGMWSCKKNDSDFLNTPPTAFLTTDQVFSDPSLVKSVLADLYNRQIDFSSFDINWSSFADFSESFPSENGSAYFVQRTGWPYNSWGVNWTSNYQYIRDLNLFLERDSASSALLAKRQS